MHFACQRYRTDLPNFISLFCKSMPRKLASAGRSPSRRIVEFVTMPLDYPTLANVILFAPRTDTTPLPAFQVSALQGLPSPPISLASLSTKITSPLPRSLLARTFEPGALYRKLFYTENSYRLHSDVN